MGADWISLANVTAVGASVGFTGKTEPLKHLEKALRGKSTASGSAGELQRRLQGLVQAGKVGVDVPHRR